MEQVLDVLGFADTAGIVWNTLAYIGMIMIIIAVISARLRNWLFVFGPLILLIYAWFYLHNPILASLQFVATVSGALNLRNIKKSAPFIVIGLAVLVFTALLAAGQISGLWPWFGALGLLGIALGLTQLPRKRGFAIMAIGGLLIVVYAGALQIWVFFVLNIVFFFANILELRKQGTKMVREKVFICIRLRPNKEKPRHVQEKELQENLRRARLVARYAVLNGFNPEATTIYFTQFLDDFSEEERKLGMEVGRERLLSCQKLWWIENDGSEPLPSSSGKWGDKRFAQKHGIAVEYKDFNEIVRWLKEYDRKGERNG